MKLILLFIAANFLSVGAFAQQRLQAKAGYAYGELAIKRDVTGQIQGLSTVSAGIEVKDRLFSTSYEATYSSNRNSSFKIFNLNAGLFYFPLKPKLKNKRVYDIKVGGGIGLGCLQIHDMHLGGMYYEKVNSLLLTGNVEADFLYTLNKLTTLSLGLSFVQMAGMQEINIEMSQLRAGMSVQYKF